MVHLQAAHTTIYISLCKKKERSENICARQEQQNVERLLTMHWSARDLLSTGLLVLSQLLG